jgi:hypothetical protein
MYYYQPAYLPHHTCRAQPSGENIKLPHRQPLKECLPTQTMLCCAVQTVAFAWCRYGQMRERGELDANGNYQEGEGPQIASDNCYCARCQRLRKVGVYVDCCPVDQGFSDRTVPHPKTTSEGSNPGHIEQPKTGNSVKFRVWNRSERGDPIQNLDQNGQNVENWHVGVLNGQTCHNIGPEKPCCG